METSSTAPSSTSPGFRRWCDPEWLPFVGFLLVPALLSLVVAQPGRASFFAGMALYAGAAKWLGWLALGRSSRLRPPCLLFPAEVLAGVAPLALWFYLRNLLALFWPASYGLRELSALTCAVAGLHLADLALRRRAGGPRPPWRPRLASRAAVYGPYAAALAVALWPVAGSLGVQGTDAIFHAFAARVARREGLAFPAPPLGQPLAYPSGFGALNAVATAVAPLSAVQAVNLQHVLLIVTAVALMASAVAALSGRALARLHLGVPLFLGLVPLYGLFPDIDYSSTPRQAALALLVAAALLPLLLEMAWAPLLLGAAAAATLAVLAVALNPACAPFALAAVVVSGLLAWSRARGAGLARAGLLPGALAALPLAPGLLVLAVDPYYGPRLRQALGPAAAPAAADGTPAAAARELPWQPPPGTRFLAADAVRALAAVRPLALSPSDSMVVLPKPLKHLQDWPDRWPYQALPGLAFLAGAVALVRWRRAPSEARHSSRNLVLAVAGGAALWLLLKYGITFLKEGLPTTSLETSLLRNYLGFLLLRHEVCLVYWILVAALTAHYLLEETAKPRQRGFRRYVVPLGGMLATGAALAATFGGFTQAGYTVVHESPWNAVTADDVTLVAWLDDNVAPGEAVGLAAKTFTSGPGQIEKHIYPVEGAQAVLFYGRHYNYRFALPSEGPRAIEEYRRHVRDRFDPGWCLGQGLRYFYATDSSLALNPGLRAAVQEGRHLREVRRAGKSAIYEVVGGGIRPAGLDP